MVLVTLPTEGAIINSSPLFFKSVRVSWDRNINDAYLGWVDIQVRPSEFRHIKATGCLKQLSCTTFNEYIRLMKPKRIERGKARGTGDEWPRICAAFTTHLASWSRPMKVARKKTGRAYVTDIICSTPSVWLYGWCGCKYHGRDFLFLAGKEEV